MGSPLRSLALLLLAVGLARAVAVVSHDPLMGYGNQYDMHRTGACLGLFPDVPGPVKLDATPDGPIDRYRSVERMPKDCYPATEVIFAGAVQGVAKAMGADHVRLRWIGALKLTLLAAAVLLVAWSLRAHAAAALAHAAVVALVLCDPAVILWLNTLYSEFSIVWGLYCAIAGLVLLSWGTGPRIALGVMLAAGIASLAFSREQFAWLPAALALLALPWLRRCSARGALGLVAFAFVASLVSFTAIDRPPEIRRANRADAYLGLLLPSSANPPAALASLGLPARCEPLIGTTWYVRRGLDPERQCPEVLALPSTAFLALAWDDPQAISNALARALPAVMRVAPPFVGAVEGPRHIGIREVAPWARSPLDEGSRHLPWLVFAVMMIAALGALAVGTLGWVTAWRSRTRPVPGLLLMSLLALTACYAFATSVLGDGLSEPGRHFHAGSLALDSLFLLGVLAAALNVASQPVRVSIWIAMLLVAAAGVHELVRDSLRTRPLAIAGVGEPASRAQLPQGDLRFSGWALDPFGVARVEVEVQGMRREATYGLPSPDLDEIFPAYPDARGGYFSLDIPATQRSSAGAQPDFRILVRNREGAVTVIDRGALHDPRVGIPHRMQANGRRIPET